MLLAVKAHHTRDAMKTIAPRLAPSGYVVSLQNGINEPEIVAAVGEERVVGAFVNFGADVVGPGRILRGNRATFRIGELDGSDDRPRQRQLAADIADARGDDERRRATCGRRRPTARCSSRPPSPTCRSPTPWPTRPTGRSTWRSRARCSARRRLRPEPFDGFDPADLDGSIDRLVEFNRGSAKTHSGIYRDLAVRHRKTEVDAMLGALEGPLIRRTGELIHAIEDGRRVCERANLDLLAAYERLERLGRPLNAVIDVVDAPDRRRRGRSTGGRSLSRTTWTCGAS